VRSSPSAAFSRGFRDDESLRLADALKASGAPNRSFLILKSIQTGLRSSTLAGLRKRGRILYFWRPTEIMLEVRRLAKERHVTHQSLIRHFLFTHPSKTERRDCSSTKSTHTRRTRNHRHRNQKTPATAWHIAHSALARKSMQQTVQKYEKFSPPNPAAS